MHGVKGLVAVITGGGGVLGSVLAAGLARAGVWVAVLDLDEGKAAAFARAGGQ